MTPFKIVIPARYASTRLPGKPLKKLNGKTLIEHVYIAATKTDADEVIIATDHLDIMDAVTSFGGEAIMTKENHLSGTDRIHEVATLKQWNPSTIVVNLQGDEPLVQADNIHSLVELLSINDSADMSTLAVRISDMKAIVDPNVVKVVLDHSKFALYFSRAPIPWIRECFDINSMSEIILPKNTPSFYAHVGLYAYKVKTLQAFSTLVPSDLEVAESLEQLRLLSNGMKIIVSISDTAPAHGVDTPADLLAVEKILSKTK